MEEQRVNVVLDFTAPISAAQTVGDAFRIEVDIVVFRAPEAITVPLGALLRSGPDGPRGWSRAIARAGAASRRHGAEA